MGRDKQRKDLRSVSRTRLLSRNSIVSSTASAYRLAFAGSGRVPSVGVVGLIGPVDLLMQLFELLGEALHVEPAEQGLVEPLVLDLRGRLVGLPGDRLDAECRDAGNQRANDTAPGWVQSDPVVRLLPMRDPVGSDGFPHHCEGAVGGSSR